MKPFERLTLEQNMLPAPASAQTPRLLSASSAASRQAKEAIRLTASSSGGGSISNSAVPNASSTPASAQGSTVAVADVSGPLPAVKVPKTKAGFGVVHLCVSMVTQSLLSTKVNSQTAL